MTTDDSDGSASGGGTSGGDPSGGTTGDSSGGNTTDDSTGGDPTGGDPTTTGGDPTTTGGDPTTTGGDPTTTGGGAGDVPDNAYCQDVADWDPGWAQLEEDILVLVNQYRSQGANCGSEGNFGPTSPLTMQPNLRCAARVHSKDMNDRNFFDHVNPSGEDPFDRMQMAGYSFSTAGENIAGGSPDAAGTMDQWMNSDGHCRNIMNPNFTEIGVGYYPGGQWGHLWTQAFGRP